MLILGRFQQNSLQIPQTSLELRVRGTSKNCPSLSSLWIKEQHLKPCWNGLWSKKDLFLVIQSFHSPVCGFPPGLELKR